MISRDLPIICHWSFIHSLIKLSSSSVVLGVVFRTVNNSWVDSQTAQCLATLLPLDAGYQVSAILGDGVLWLSRDGWPNRYYYLN